MKIRPVRTELFHADGQTDMTKLVVAIRNFVKVPKNETRVGECMYVCTYIYIYIYIYIGCAGGSVPDFGRMFLKLKYTDITKNTYIRS